MTTQELYTKGTSVWLPSDETVWQLGTLVDDFAVGNTTLDVRVENGSIFTVKVANEKGFPPLRNPEIFRGLSDLTQLSYLHEPAVLHNLRVRFAEYKTIYTYCGIVLVAINPYQEMNIYDNGTMETYRGCAMGELDPHIFAIAEEAFTKMEREDRDQSIIVSGESGAGKTVSAKYVMRYVAEAKGSTTNEHNVEKRVLATNPIMEAIGNAKTTRNDNSSRFGKFIEIDFDKHFAITGAKMRTYLLEKSRVVFQSPDERNYHIFYQLCAAAKERPRDYVELRLDAPEEFRYTNQGQNTVITGVDDFEAFQETCYALDLLSFPQEDQYIMFRILAAILHLGDIRFIPLNDDSSSVVDNDPHLSIFASLLGINASQMSMWLTKKKLVTVKDQMTKSLRLQEAEAGRDAFAKHIYSRLFNWVVGHVNRKLIPDRQPHHFIGVLDIYGFETFQKNSFEQFCINYANEKLQQQFVIHVFKLEQEEYIKEEIEWTMIDFFDNQPCIDLIEGRLGILDLLDEECRMPKGSDGTWNRKMISTAKDKEKAADKSWKYFEKPRFSEESFIINHFADKVEYDSDGFLDKNRDTMNEEFVNLLRASEFPLVAQLFQDGTPETLTAGKSPPRTGSTPTKAASGFTHSNTPTPRAAGAAHKSHTQSVGSQFQDSLRALMDTLNRTTPHYVRCIKPNDEKAAFGFDPKRAIQQLRACGVLETIRISAAGYPSRWTYKDFFVRYRVMCRSKEIDRTNIRKTVEIIVTKLIDDRDKYKFGKTMIFFRAGQVAYMEKLRADRRMACGLIIQKIFRGRAARRKYLEMRRAALAIQTAARGYLARKHYQHLRRSAAALKIQTAFRGYQQRKKFATLRSMAIRMQALTRGKAARKMYQARLLDKLAVGIQSIARGFMARRRYQKQLRRIILVQSCIRRFLAKRKLKALKIQARDVNHVKQLNKGLENKIFTLQQKVDELNGELVTRRKMDAEVLELRTKAAGLRQLEADLHSRTSEIALLHATIAELRTTISTHERHTESLTEDIRNLRSTVITKDQQAAEQSSKHAEEMQTLRRENQALHEVSKSQSGLLTKEYDERIGTLERDLLEEREARQRALDDLDRVRQRHSNLEDQMKIEGRQARSLQRTPSDASNDSDNSATASTVFVPEIGDDGYSTQRSKATSRRGAHNGWPGFHLDSTSPKPGMDGFVEDDGVVGDANHSADGLFTGIDAAGMDEVQVLREQNSILKHQLEMRPAVDEIVSEKIKRHLEVNLALRSSLARCQSALSGPLDEAKMDELRASLAILTEQTTDDLATSIPNVTVDDVGTLDPTSLNQLFLSLREALAIQATETRQLMTGRNVLSERYTQLMKENDCLKIMLANLSKSSNLRDGLSRLAEDTTKTMIANETLLKENKGLKKKVHQLEKALGQRDGTSAVNILNDADLEDDVPLIQHLKAGHMGMIEYPQSATEHLVRCLTSVPPELASTLNYPGLPAYLLFMAVRYTDQINNEKAVKELLSGAKNAIQNVLKNKKAGMEHFAMWLLNGLRLVDLMKQYSGDEKYQRVNTLKQNQHALRQFDLSAFRQQYDDLCVSIYRSLVTFMQRELKDDAAKAIIEHESVLGLKEPGTLPRRWRTKSPAECFTSTMTKLNQFFRMVTQDHALDPSLVRQIFKQLLYCLSANSVNFLMQSQKTCTFVVGIQIRANLSQIHEFVRLHSATFHGDDIMQALAAITECAHIFQARKAKEEDIDGIISMSKFLSNAQIIKLLQNYSPAEAYDAVTPEFVQKIQTRLQDRPEPTAPGLQPGSYILSTDYVYPVVFPYTPSNVELDTIQIPKSLHMEFVKKI
ncbi:Unconventional myosin-Vb [Hypsibius exemplaris]|uniref:Unconventional myosin-Vb n=1 Tax=Hypsibius exemplaris TaxID=2072580 RepID=A0A1W0XF45_HYPEX|nr:Unconventional myosin-Vb [Hypsibius exemplaris]